MCLAFFSAFSFIQFILYFHNSEYIPQDQNLNMSLKCCLLPQVHLPYGVVSFLSSTEWTGFLVFSVSFCTVRWASYAPLRRRNANSLPLIELSVLLRISRFACKHLWTERRTYVGFSQLPVLCICSANFLTLSFEICNSYHTNTRTII